MELQHHGGAFVYNTSCRGRQPCQPLHRLAKQRHHFHHHVQNQAFADGRQSAAAGSGGCGCAPAAGQVVLLPAGAAAAGRPAAAVLVVTRPTYRYPVAKAGGPQATERLAVRFVGRMPGGCEDVDQEPGAAGKRLAAGQVSVLRAQGTRTRPGSSRCTQTVAHWRNSIATWRAIRCSRCARGDDDAACNKQLLVSGCTRLLRRRLPDGVTLGHALRAIFSLQQHIAVFSTNRKSRTKNSLIWALLTLD